MRLLHTKKLSFEEFFDSKVPVYAILSHRWEEAEVSFQDFEEGKKKDGSGYRKILNCCALARSQGFDWVWIDTCCIDKKSSAELSEAINSMFNWYVGAGICYAYLSDVQYKTVDGRRVATGLEESKWFTRGWTLQELLAPDQVLFFDHYWKAIGAKNKNNITWHKLSSLSTCLSRITGIPTSAFASSDWRHRSSVAQLMSWAAGRKTSRTEDLAYCLMGIFGVNMPLLYGEGGKAFIRLQQEIIKQSSDESIFAWRIPPKVWGDRSLFASSPDWFARSGNVKRSYHTSWINYSPFIITDTGILMDVHLIRNGQMWLLPLNCETEDQQPSTTSVTKSRRNAVVLRRVTDTFFNKEHSKELDIIDNPDFERLLQQYEKEQTGEQLQHKDASGNLPPGVHSFRRVYILSNSGYLKS